MKLIRSLPLVVIFGVGSVAQAAPDFHLIHHATDRNLDDLAQVLRADDRAGDCRKVVLAKIVRRGESRGRTDEKVTEDLIADVVRENVSSFARRNVSLDPLRGLGVLPGSHRIERMLEHGYIGESATRARLRTRFLQTLRAGNLALFAGDATTGTGDDGYVIAVYDIVNDEALSLSMRDFTVNGGCSPSLPAKAASPVSTR